MRLVFPPVQLLHDTISGRIAFPAFDGQTAVRCSVSREALEDRSARAGTGAPGLVDIFNIFRGDVEAAAARKYAAGKLEADGSILVKTADLNP